MVRVFGFCAVIFALMAGAANGGEKPLTVCEALSSGANYVKVAIRGDIARGQHGVFLVDASLHGDPCPGWPRHVFTAPSNIGLEFTSSHGVSLTKQQERMDLEILKRLAKLCRMGGPPYRGTLEGVLVRNWSLICRGRDGRYFSIGLDWDNVIPAFLVLTKLRED